MSTVILVIHLMVAAALVGLVLLQRSEGGALGIGGGGGLMTGRGTANALTKATAVVAVVFFLTSISLTWLASRSTAPSSILDGVPAQQQNQGQGVLPKLQPTKPAEPQQPSGPQVPQSQ